MPEQTGILEPQADEQLVELQELGLVSPEGTITPRGVFEANLSEFVLGPGEADRYREFYDRGFIRDDFSETEDGRIYFMDKGTVLHEGQEAFARWYELGAWDEWEDKIAPRDPETGEKLPFHKVVGMGLKALATEMVPQAGQAAGLTARATTPEWMSRAYDWLGGLKLFGAPIAPALGPLIPGAPAAWMQREVREAAGLSFEEMEQMADDIAAASIGKTVVEGKRNWVWIDKGLELQRAWAGKELYGKDLEDTYVQKLYEFEDAMQEFDDMDAVDGIASAVAFKQVMQGLVGLGPKTLEEQLEEIERAKEWVREARARMPEDLLQEHDVAFGSLGEFIDAPIPTTLAASWSLKIGKRLTSKATRINREIAEKTAKRAVVQRYIDRGVQARLGAGHFKQKVAALTDEIGDLQGQLGKIEATTGLGGTLKDLTRGVGRQTTEALSKAMSGTERFLGKRDWGAKALDMLDSAKVGISTATKFRSFALMAGSAAGTGAGFAAGGPLLAGAGLLATLPGRLNILKAAFLTAGSMGSEFLKRRGTNPYWQRVAEASRGNVWARNGALGMDLFRYPARVAGGAAGAGAKGMIAEAPFAMIGSLHRGPEVWAAEMMSEGLLFSSPGMVKGMVHGMGGMPAIAKRAEFDRMALADAAELRRDLDTDQQRAAFDRLSPVDRRKAGVYGATFPDIQWVFDPDATESSWNNHTKRMTIATRSSDPMGALIGHEVAHHLHDRGLVDLVKEELVGANGALRMTESQYLLSEAKKNQRGEVVLPSEAELQAERDRARMDAEGNIILPDDPGEAGLSTVLPELMPLNELGKEVKQKYEARRGETIGDDELALEYYAESVGAALSGNRIKLQELVRRHPLVRRLIDGTLNRFAFGREFLLRNGVLFDRHGNPISGQGVMGAIAQSPTLARATETYLRENAGRTVESVSEKAVNRALSQAEPLTAEEEARAIEEDIVNYAFDEDGNTKYLPNGRPEGIDEETWKGRATAGLTIIQDLAERYGVEPVTFKNGEKAYRLSRTQWDEVLRLLHESGWYNPRQLKIFEGMIDAVSRVPGDSFHLHYHGVYSTDKVGKKRVPKQGRHPKSKLGVPYDITVSKHGNILFRMIDMDQLQNNAEKAFNTKLGKELYNSTAEIMRDLEILAKNHKEGKLNLEHFGRQDKVNFLNAILGEINKEHTVKNPLLLKPIFKGFKNKYASIKSFRLDRINRARLANAKALPFRVEEWQQNLMPGPAEPLKENEVLLGLYDDGEMMTRRGPTGLVHVQAFGAHPTRNGIRWFVRGSELTIYEEVTPRERALIREEAEHMLGPQGVTRVKGLGVDPTATKLQVVDALDPDIRRMPEQLDADHRAAVETGDTETAQRLVDEAAEKAGLARLYHGTEDESFTRFDVPAYFSDSKDFAGRFGSKVRELFVLSKNPERINGLTDGRHFEWDAEDVAEFRKRGRDSVHISHPEGDVVAVFGSNQIKSADPATYDDQGNLIPLSERFDLESDDIRRMPAKPEWVGDYPTYFDPAEPVVSVENQPGFGAGILRGLHTAKASVQRRFFEEIEEAISHPKSGDVIAHEMGLAGLLGPEGLKATEPAMSVYINKTGKIEINQARQVGGFVSREAAELYALIRGYYTYQEAVAGYNPVEGGDMTGAQFYLGRGLKTKGEVTGVMRTVKKALRDAGLKKRKAAEDFAFYPTPEGFNLVHLGFNPDITPAIRDAALNAVREYVKIDEAVLFDTDTFYEFNNWTPDDIVEEDGNVIKSEPGGGYFRQAIKAKARSLGRPNILTGVDRRIGSRLQTVYEKYSEALGLGRPGRQPARRFKDQGALKGEEHGPEAIPVRYKTHRTGELALDKDGKPKPIEVPYKLTEGPFVDEPHPAPRDPTIGYLEDGNRHYDLTGPNKNKLRKLAENGSVDAAADRLVDEATKALQIPEIASGLGWYSRMREKLGSALGEFFDIFTQFLGATSAQTPVETNFSQSMDVLDQYQNGKFDETIPAYLALRGAMKEGIEATRELLIKEGIKPKGKTLSKLADDYIEAKNLMPQQYNGALFNANGSAVLKVLAGVWFQEVAAPKTPQFAMNLFGTSLRATIDVWAARTLRRIFHRGTQRWRIQPESETGVNNLDFALGQMVFARAAERLGMSPDDLQALMWFAEKDTWAKNGWTGEIGAFKGSFDAAAEVYFPTGREPRRLDHGRNIITFLQKRRLVEHDDTLPPAETKKEADLRKTHVQDLREAFFQPGVQEWLVEAGTEKIR